MATARVACGVSAATIRAAPSPSERKNAHSWETPRNLGLTPAVAPPATSFAGFPPLPAPSPPHRLATIEGDGRELRISRRFAKSVATKSVRLVDDPGQLPLKVAPRGEVRCPRPPPAQRKTVSRGLRSSADSPLPEPTRSTRLSGRSATR